MIERKGCSPRENSNRFANCSRGKQLKEKKKNRVEMKWMAFSYELILVKYLDILSASHSRSSFFDKRWDQDRFLFPGATSTKTRKSCRQQGLDAGKNSGGTFSPPFIFLFTLTMPSSHSFSSSRGGKAIGGRKARRKQRKRRNKKVDEILESGLDGTIFRCKPSSLRQQILLYSRSYTSLSLPLSITLLSLSLSLFICFPSIYSPFAFYSLALFLASRNTLPKSGRLRRRRSGLLTGRNSAM